METFSEVADAEAAVALFERMVASGDQPQEEHFDWTVRAIRQGSNYARQRDDQTFNMTRLLGRIVATSSTPKQEHQRYDLIVRKVATLGLTDLAAEWYERAAAAGVRCSKSTCEFAARASMADGEDLKVLSWLRRVQPIVDANVSVKSRLADFVQRCAVGLGRGVDLAALDATAKLVRRLSLSHIDPAELPFEQFIISYARSGNLEQAADWVNKMIEAKLKPSQRAYTELLRLTARDGQTESARRWFQRIKLSGYVPDLTAYNDMLLSFVVSRNSDGAVEWVNGMLAEGVVPDGRTYSLVIGSFSKAGDPSSAVEWQDRAEAQGVVLSWEAYYLLVRVHVEVGDLARALEAANTMANGPQKTGARVWTMQMQAATGSVLMSPELVKNIFRGMMKAGYEPGITVLTSMELALGREESEALFEETDLSPDHVQRILAR